MKFNDMFFSILWNCALCFLPMNENTKKLCFEISCSIKAVIGKHSKQGFYVMRKRKKIAFIIIAM